MTNSTKNKRRMFHILIVIVIGWFVLFVRLLDIQILEVRDFSDRHIDLLTRSVEQREQEFILSSGRGNIFDRNMDSLLEQKEIKTIIVFPFSKDMINREKINQLAEDIDTNQDDLYQQIRDLDRPSYLKQGTKPIELTDQQEELVNQLAIPGIIAIPYTIQNYNEVLAKHVLGYLGQAPDVINTDYQKYVERGILKQDSLIGRSGLEMSFQELLMGIGESKIAYFVDNQGHPLNGLSSKYNLQKDSYYPLSLVTTIDKKIQQIAEEQFKKYGIKDGSVVVLNPDNSDILAMASVPDFDLLHLDPNSSDWNNKGVQVIAPGSTFKTLIAIAGLQEGIVSPNEQFYCSGVIPAYHFSCHTVHGDLTFAEGYADSCNIVFAEVAERLGPEKIEAYAEKLGLVGKIGWQGEFFNNDSFSQIENEETNRVFHPDTNINDLGSIMRTAIGQQDVRISPLAAANLIVTILNNGIVHEPRLVSKVIYRNGTDYYDFPVHQTDSKVASSDTFQEIRALMEKVVKEGTGQLLKQAKWSIAGKTGTAETNNDRNHQWFIGYGPTENPQYAIAIVVKNVKTSNPLAKKVFIGIMDGLAEMNE